MSRPVECPISEVIREAVCAGFPVVAGLLHKLDLQPSADKGGGTLQAGKGNV